MIEIRKKSGSIRTNVRKRALLLVIVTLLFGFSGPPSVSAVYTFEQTNTDGFGVSGNRVFSFKTAAVNTGGWLWASTSNITTGAKLWRTDTGDPGDWDAVVTDGFGNTDNVSIGMLVRFGDFLYAGTENTVFDAGAEIWRCDMTSVDCAIETNWAAVVADGVDGNDVGADESGFGMGNTGSSAAVNGIGDGVVVGSELYVGTLGDATVWKTSNGTTWTQSSDQDFGMSIGGGASEDIRALIASDTAIYAGMAQIGGIGALTGAQVWRCLLASLCDAAGDWSRVSDPGFGATNPWDVARVNAMAFLDDGSLYAGMDEETGGEGGKLYRCDEEVTGCASQADWSQVGTNGFGNPENYAFTTLFTYANTLYVGAGNVTSDEGTELWRTVDGATIELVQDGGFGDGLNNDPGTIINFGNDLHVFVDDALSGAAAYRANLDPVLTLASAAQDTDGSGRVAAGVTMDDPDTTPTGEFKVEYSLDGGATYADATLSTTDADTTATAGDPSIGNGQIYQVGTGAGYVDISAGPNTVAFVWRAAVDAPDTETTEAMLRLTPYDGFGEGDPIETAAFTVDTLDPVISGLETDVAVVKAGETITITFDVSEALPTNPAVTVNGMAATFVSVSGLSYTYTYDVTGDEEEGNVDVVVVATDGFGNEGNATTSVELDFMPPVTTASPVAGAYTTAQSVTLSSDDVEAGAVRATASGVDAIYYTTDGSDPTIGSTVYDSPIDTTDDGTTVIKFFAVDGVGNEESIKTAAYVITPIIESAVSGTIFRDDDHNHAQNAAEPGLGEVIITLYTDTNGDGSLDFAVDTLVSTKTTAADGSYAFAGLPQDGYLLFVDESTIPAGYTLTTANNPGYLGLFVSGQTFVAKFGYAPPAGGSGPVPPPSGGGDGGRGSGDAEPTPEPSETPSNDGTGDDGSTETEPNGGSTKSNNRPPDEYGPGKKDESLIRPDGKKTGGVTLGEQVKALGRKTGEVFVSPAGMATLFGVLSFGNMVAAGTGLLSYLQYLLQLITEPFRLLAGNRRKRWGVVYDALTGRPLDLAIVRLLDAQTGRLLQTSVTDQHGRYLFLVKGGGRYRMTVTKPDYVFPPNEAPVRPGSYTGGVIGESIAVLPEGSLPEVIQIDIPMTSVHGKVFLPGSRKPAWIRLATLAAFRSATQEERSVDDRRLTRAARWRLVARLFAWVGPLVALVSLLREPSWLTGGLFFGHIVLLYIFRRLAIHGAGKPWGKVVDAEDRQTLSGAIVRLFDDHYGKLLLAKVTSGDGRYAFLTGEGAYQLTASKEQYVFPRGVVSVRGRMDKQIAEDLIMRKGEMPTVPTRPAPSMTPPTAVPFRSTSPVVPPMPPVSPSMPPSMPPQQPPANLPMTPPEQQ